MKSRPWLEKDDDRWSQQLRWNIAREMFFESWDNRKMANVYGAKCPLIEEAQWFVANVPYICPIDRSDMVELILKRGKTARHLLYSGTISRNNNMIRDAALNGDPIAQCKMALIPSEIGQARQWLQMSMDGGYSEAFKLMVDRYLLDYVEVQECLQRGVAAASPSAIAAYAKLTTTNIHEALYLTGRVWQIMYYKENAFTGLVKDWYSKPSHQRDITAGFIIGRLFNQIQPYQIKSLKTEIKYRVLCDSLNCAHQMYMSMCQKTQIAVIAWLLVSRHLPIVTDLRKVIAHLIWRTRDQSEWL